MFAQLTLFAPVRVCDGPECDVVLTCNPRKKYCDGRCYRAAYRAANRERKAAADAVYRATNREKIAASGAAYRAMKRAEEMERRSALPVRVCNGPECDAALTGDIRKKYCGGRCKHAANYAANREKKSAGAAAYRAANSEKVAAYNAAYYAATKERDKERKERNHAAWYMANRKKVLAQSAAWRAANPEMAKARKAAYYAANREKIAAYRAANPEKMRKHRARRRAREACVVPQRWRKRNDVPDSVCYWCGADGVDHLDHIMPISLGGPAVPSNEVMTCQPCNQRKHAKHPLVWIAELLEA